MRSLLIKKKKKKKVAVKCLNFSILYSNFSILYSNFGSEKVIWCSFIIEWKFCPIHVTRHGCIKLLSDSSKLDVKCWFLTDVNQLKNGVVLVIPHMFVYACLILLNHPCYFKKKKSWNLLFYGMAALIFLNHPCYFKKKKKNLSVQ